MLNKDQQIKLNTLNKICTCIKKYFFSVNRKFFSKIVRHSWALSSTCVQWVCVCVSFRVNMCYMCGFVLRIYFWVEFPGVSQTKIVCFNQKDNAISKCILTLYTQRAVSVCLCVQCNYSLEHVFQWEKLFKSLKPTMYSVRQQTVVIRVSRLMHKTMGQWIWKCKFKFCGIVARRHQNLNLIK